jgi:hypothetical protein
MASIIKADNIQKVSDGTNIIKKCGSTITLGSCGATISLASGATQTGFGRTGTVDWCTTAKTAPFTGVSGKGYFVNTTSGAVTVTLPATPTAGDIVSLKDYGNTWQTNALSVCNNGSKINGVCATASLSTQGQSVTLIYVDATKGWQDINDSTSSVTGAAYISATGGTVTTCGNYKIHTFTADGCFAVTATAIPANNKVDYLVVAGGGGAGYGGAGAGGFRESKCACVSGCWTASPLASATSLTVTSTTYPITVGGGGVGATPTPRVGGCGSNSIFSTITSAGGGATWYCGPAPTPIPSLDGKSGGSGGGGSWNGFSASGSAGGAGNTPPTSPPQGNSGGSGYHDNTYGAQGGGGGGATAAGISIPPSVPVPTGGDGGAGAGTGINPSCTVGTPGPTPSLRYFAGGGGGSGAGSGPQGPFIAGDGGVGGGGGAQYPPTCRCGQTNTGGGGFGGGKAGGSGIVIIRYRYQ